MNTRNIVVSLPIFMMLVTCVLSCFSYQSFANNIENCQRSLVKGSNCQANRLLHVPSPDWRDQVIYFLMIDRFADGDASNNDQGAGVYNPARESHYSGGDLKGIINNIPYIKNLGATAVWTTPHVANMWWDPENQYSGYHGYWARDFKSVDEHYGNLDDYKDLSDVLHRSGMYLIQDIVVNHVGNYFSYHGEFDPNYPEKNFYINKNARPTNAPEQPPFHFIDVTNPIHRDKNIYHWTPEIVDFSNKHQETTYQTSSLSDLNTENPTVINALKDSFGYWVKEAGVDAIRIDTVKYVKSTFYEDFLHGKGGIYEVAETSGRDNFYSFGEVFNTSQPYLDDGEKKISEYITSDDSKKIDAPLGFPLYKEIGRVFSEGAPTAYLSYRLEAYMREYHNPYLVANFIDNHDVDRFLSSGTVDNFRLAYVLLMTIPGVPVIYQGDEQLFTSYRKAMFAGGYQSEKNYFDKKSSMYRFIKKLIEIRKSNKVFSRGSLEILQDNTVGAGIFVYKREYKNKVAYTILNTSNSATLLNNLLTDFSSDDKPNIVLSEKYSKSLKFSNYQTLTFVAPANSAMVLIGDKDKHKLAREKIKDQIVFESIDKNYLNKRAALIKGSVSEPFTQLQGIIDGAYDNATNIIADKNGHWKFEIPVNDLGSEEHFVEIYWPAKKLASKKKFYTTRTTIAEFSQRLKDPKLDHTGPYKSYLLPTHESVGCEMDIEEAEIRSAGRILELTLSMCQVSDIWQPPNQFDHVAFSIFFDTDISTGIEHLPIIGGSFPNGGKWNFSHISYGWGNYIYTTHGASLKSEGSKLGVAPKIEVNKKNNTIRFTYDGKELGLNDWRNAKIYITTWDKDGGGAYRNLGEKVGTWRFGGAKERHEKILDDALIYIK
ncbi:alpha-amylase family glycosyl hydrolase [Agarilytica rhodophyticola]|uniref:alpha-amylase family glycosyl hydrolase n=1 Tax=Agarilytica rhodophyticola TaxID=1737490 RepID=UPI001FEC5963|nr:alpha-amylase family glycosyl hydrolase [Agarilytica rhodophyticola]